MLAERVFLCGQNLWYQYWCGLPRGFPLLFSWELGFALVGLVLVHFNLVGTVLGYFNFSGICSGSFLFSGNWFSEPPFGGPKKWSWYHISEQHKGDCSLTRSDPPAQVTLNDVIHWGSPLWRHYIIWQTVSRLTRLTCKCRASHVRKHPKSPWEWYRSLLLVNKQSLFPWREFDNSKQSDCRETKQRTDVHVSSHTNIKFAL